jgi:predicted outer membrane protein
MTLRRGRLALGSVLAALAVGAATACSSATPAAPPPAAPAATAPGAAAGSPAPGAGGQATEAERAAFGQAHQNALALVAFGGLGGEQGVGDQVKGLAPELESLGRSIDEQVRAQATAQGVVLGDQLSAAQQSTLADLQARSGVPFDQAWLRAALDLEQRARDAANAVLADPNASAEAKQAARDSLVRLDALRARLSAAASAAGAATPGSVDAGTGGQAAQQDSPAPAFALIGVGVALLVGAGVWWRRRSA